MTLEETYEYFKEMIDGCGAYELCPCGKDDMEMTKIALSAIEKQIPKKPKKDEYDYYVCPSCGADDYALMHDSNIADKYNFCHTCGQALDWSDKE